MCPLTPTQIISNLSVVLSRSKRNHYKFFDIFAFQLLFTSFFRIYFKATSQSIAVAIEFNLRNAPVAHIQPSFFDVIKNN